MSEEERDRMLEKLDKKLSEIIEQARLLGQLKEEAEQTAEAQKNRATLNQGLVAHIQLQGAGILEPQPWKSEVVIENRSAQSVIVEHVLFRWLPDEQQAKEEGVDARCRELVTQGERKVFLPGERKVFRARDEDRAAIESVLAALPHDRYGVYILGPVEPSGNLPVLCYIAGEDIDDQL